MHVSGGLFNTRRWQVLKVEARLWPYSKIVLVCAALLLAWSVDWYLVTWGYPVAAIYSVAILLAASLSWQLVALTTALALGISVTSNNLQQAPPVAWLADNLGLALIGTVTVLFVQQRSEAARRAVQAAVAEAHYRSIFEGAADAILATDAEGRCTDANLAATELLDYSREELLQVRLSELLLAEPDRAQLLGELGQLGLLKSWRGELHLRRKDGTLVPVEGRVVKLELPGGTVYRGTWRDVSDRHELEQMQREFLAMVTHELRNPLTPIRAYADFMRRRGVYEERAVETIIAATRHLDRLIGDLLDVSRLETGHLELRRERADLVALAEASARRAGTSSPLHHVRVESPAGPLEGHWDRDRVEQILDNLLTNAVKYSPAGGEVVVQITDLGSASRVSVIDQGPGIPPKLLPHLFERFYRAHADAGPAQAGGLGLGLCITRGLVEAHGGRVWVESEPGHGATFRFTLPYEPPAQPASA